jgi:hypothetical protein
VEQRVPGQQDAEVRRVQAHRPGRMARGVQDLEPGARHLHDHAVGERLGLVPACTTSQSIRSSGCRSTGAPVASATSRQALTWSLCACVQTTATSRRSPTAARIGGRVVRRVDHDDLVVVTDEPDVVVDLEVCPVELKVPEVTTFSTRAVTRQPEHHRAQHLAAVHPVEGVLDVADGIVSETNASRSSRPCR